MYSVIRKYWDSPQLFLENIQACQENIHYGWVENRIQKWSENPTGKIQYFKWIKKGTLSRPFYTNNLSGNAGSTSHKPAKLSM